MTFDSIINYLNLAARDSLNEFTKNTKCMLIIYLISTVGALILDLVEFFIVAEWFGRYQSAFGDLALVAIASIFLFIDWFYIMYIFSLTYKFPSYMSSGFTKGLLGLMESLHNSLGRAITS